MTARATNAWKLGMFVVTGVVLTVLALFWLGARRFNVETVERVTYFDESVQGLEVGAPVKMRGVTIGKVSAISIAPDRKLVEVRALVRVDALRRLGLLGAQEEVSQSTADLPEDLRVIAATTGITGVKFLEVDFVPANTPMPVLGFSPPLNYIPSARSALKSLEDAVRGLSEELPPALGDLRELTGTLNDRLAAIDTEALSSNLVRILEQLDEALSGSDGRSLGAEVNALVSEARATMNRFDEMIVRMVSDTGPLERAATGMTRMASEAARAVDAAEDTLARADLPATSATLRDATASYGRLAEDLRPAARDLQDSLEELRAALRRVEDLAGYLERDPGALLRGRSPASDPDR